MHAPGKKPLDTEINVVPFIDLMAVTIAFLLITAVWSQAGVQPVSQSGGPGEASEEQPLSLRLTQRGVSLEHGEPMPFGALAPLLAGIRSATIVTDDDVRYDDLVQLIDVCRGAGVIGISVSPAT